MQFNAILTLAALAVTALATPIDVEVVARTENPPTFKCGNGQTVNCCNSVKKTKDLLGLSILEGVNCLSLDIIQIPIDNNQCKQTTACCNSGTQTGLINIGNLICGSVL